MKPVYLWVSRHEIRTLKESTSEKYLDSIVLFIYFDTPKIVLDQHEAKMKSMTESIREVEVKKRQLEEQVNIE